MTTKQGWVGLLAAVVAVGSVATASTGCKYFKKGESEETSSSKPAPPPEPEPTATSTGSAAASDEVKTYPNQTPAGGTYRLLRSFYVYQEADTNSKKLGGVGEGTIIHLKASLGQYLLIEWPSGPGVMSPGWIQVTVRGNRPDPTLIDEVREVDAGVVDAGIVDAGKPVVDAGKPPVDGGNRPRIDLKRPTKK